jgi:hypothetical protein
MSIENLSRVSSADEDAGQIALIPDLEIAQDRMG